MPECAARAEVCSFVSTTSYSTIKIHLCAIMLRRASHLLVVLFRMLQGEVPGQNRETVFLVSLYVVILCIYRSLTNIGRAIDVTGRAAWHAREKGGF